MNRILLAVLLMMVSLSLFGQVVSYEVLSSKKYENQTKTVYLKLDGYIDNETAGAITLALESCRDISKFRFFDKDDLSKCMFTSDISIHEDEIIDLINEVIYGVSLTGKDEFIKKSVERELIKYEFVIDGYLEPGERRTLEDRLMLEDRVVKAHIEPDNTCFLYVSESVNASEVQLILKQYNVSINPDFLR